MIHYLIGDATQPQAKGQKIIAHVVNNVGGWGKGFVLSVSRRWSKPETQYRQWYNLRNAVQNLPFILGETQLVNVEKDIIVANMLAQNGVGPRGGVPPIRYPALSCCLSKVFGTAKHFNASVHMPRIGCGLAGGSWSDVLPLIENHMGDVETFVYDLESKNV